MHLKRAIGSYLWILVFHEYSFLGLEDYVNGLLNRTL